ncbi:DGQHR domain-containing protein [Fodinisporobacter ferrooxydans]|uniref:DGQHR domain-containing protein n=1 Tax=Fodinisporobacter ferrooxydans TaxID=2901836 RepID=A0ABY4CM08_9BACL|nr:DGQHR domain-containing protein [Alicyclobacillaceae bacterium MYW30-H2]
MAYTLAIENVTCYKDKGRIVYRGEFFSSDIEKLTVIKRFDDPKGGYQRPRKESKCKDYARYLQDPLGFVTPVLLNAQGNWKFTAYDRLKPNFGRLVTNGRASVIDGQHRLGGLELHFKETSVTLNVPFVAFHMLDLNEEMELFDTINSKAEGLKKALLTYLEASKNEMSQLAVDLATHQDSPFYGYVSLTGIRSKQMQTNLDTLQRAMVAIFDKGKISSLTYDEKLLSAKSFFRSIAKVWKNEWNDYKNYKLRHVLGLFALSYVAKDVLNDCFNYDTRKLDEGAVYELIWNMKDFDWSKQGSLQTISGYAGSNYIAKDLLEKAYTAKQM